MIRLLLLLSLSAVLFSCTDTENPIPETPLDGGSCEYETIDAIATITAIEPLAESEDTPTVEGLLSVEVSFDKSQLSTESQYLEDLLNSHIDSSFLAEHDLTFGSQITCSVTQITKGSCFPYNLDFGTQFD